MTLNSDWVLIGVKAGERVAEYLCRYDSLKDSSPCRVFFGEKSERW